MRLCWNEEWMAICGSWWMNMVALWRKNKVVSTVVLRWGVNGDGDGADWFVIIAVRRDWVEKDRGKGASNRRKEGRQSKVSWVLFEGEDGGMSWWKGGHQLRGGESLRFTSKRYGDSSKKYKMAEGVCEFVDKGGCKSREESD